MYHEPFLGSGAVMATLAPQHARGADAYAPLMEIWTALRQDPQQLIQWYTSRYEAFTTGAGPEVYARIKADFNAAPNGADLLFLSRACYGGVVRFRKKDGAMSTPCGVHPPMTPRIFRKRVDMWAQRMSGATFAHADFRESMRQAQAGDLIYCDPPYSNTQSILYGAQRFRLGDLFDEIRVCKARGVRVALSLDGSKKSGARDCTVDVPCGLFAREEAVDLGRSMLRRFQMSGRSLENEVVRDRLLLTY